MPLLLVTSTISLSRKPRMEGSGEVSTFCSVCMTTVILPLACNITSQPTILEPCLAFCLLINNFLPGPTVPKSKFFPLFVFQKPPHPLAEHIVLLAYLAKVQHLFNKKVTELYPHLELYSHREFYLYLVEVEAKC